MSFADQLRATAPAGAMTPPLLWDDAVKYRPEDLAAHRIVWGHFGPYLPQFLGPHLRKPLVSVTMLRDPVKRSLSHFRHVARDPRHPLHEFGRSVDYAGFLADPRGRAVVANYQARFLVDLGWNLSEACERAADRLGPAPIQSSMSDDGLGRDLSDDDLFERAKAALEGMAFVGVTEEYDRSAATLARTFGWEPPGETVRRNVDPAGPTRAALDPAAAAETERLTAVDRRLYDWARDRLLAAAA
jgi:hypothetical protein